MRKDLLKGLTEEQIREAMECNTAEKILSLAKREGIELTEEQLAAVNGGCNMEVDVKPACPKCGSESFKEVKSSGVTYYECLECGTLYSGLLETR
ncbi:MAG: hypothetical protein IJ248_04155 [Candidatus Methanomethylophilaceae archaeon]|nr:hypothetical protein [Candidatus Methanomethylophilaceae archaeon]